MIKLTSICRENPRIISFGIPCSPHGNVHAYFAMEMGYKTGTVILQDRIAQTAISWLLNIFYL